MALVAKFADRTVPLESCFWVLVNPSGHVVASVGGAAFRSPEAMHAAFTPQPSYRAREQRAGWRVELLRRSQWRQVAAACVFGYCRHAKAAA
jgi:hypothetical protein